MEDAVRNYVVGPEDPGVVLSVKLTSEGIIIDCFDGDEHVGTKAMTADEWFAELAGYEPGMATCDYCEAVWLASSDLASREHEEPTCKGKHADLVEHLDDGHDLPHLEHTSLETLHAIHLHQHANKEWPDGHEHDSRAFYSGHDVIPSDLPFVTIEEVDADTCEALGYDSTGRSGQTGYGPVVEVRVGKKFHLAILRTARIDPGYLSEV